MASRPANLRDLERAAYGSRWKDGLVDLLGGLGVLMVGTAWVLNLYWAPGFAVPVLIVAWSMVRKRIVQPRIGSVTFRKERRETEEKGVQGAALFGVGVLLLSLGFAAFKIRGAGGLGAWMDEWTAALPTALLALMALVGAAMTGLSRFIGYAAVLVGTGTVATWLGLEPGPQILIAGGIITVVGITLFARFLSSHPIPADMGEDQ